jgi:RAP1 GTPase activating protein 1
MVLLPHDGGWWLLNSSISSSEQDRTNPSEECSLEKNGFDTEETARSYRSHFLGYEHYNFCAIDENLGPVVLSLKTYSEDEPSVINHTRDREETTRQI